MDIDVWKRKNSARRSYAHFDSRVSLVETWDYITKPENIARHSFRPFIHFTMKAKRFRNGQLEDKKREICYSAHMDRCIYQLYGYKLSEIYNKYVKQNGIDQCAIAYRNDLKLNNINFAKRAFDEIKRMGQCHVLIGDFSHFFDNLNHRYLKHQLCKLLEVAGLPNDYYAIYKNITKHSKWDMESLLRINGLPCTRDGVSQLNKQRLAIHPETYKAHKKTEIVKNPNNYGIPQGSAISAVFSNIYMLDFDKQVSSLIKSLGGMYMRYSDDFIILLPNNSKTTFGELYGMVSAIVREIPNLVLQQEKTKAYLYSERKIVQYDLNSDLKTKTDANISYLGFQFDGKDVSIRDKTISQYYNRMHRKAKTIARNKGVSKTGKRISCKNLYLKYSYRGAYIDDGNFLTYVDRAERIFEDEKKIGLVKRRHMAKIRKRLREKA